MKTRSKEEEAERKDHLMQTIHEKLQQYLAIHDMLKRGFPWEYALARQFGALMLTGEGQAPSAEGIKAMRDVIRRETSVFSNFRGLNELILSMLLYREPNGVERFHCMKDVYAQLKSNGFWGGTYLPMAALTIAKGMELQPMSTLIARMRDFYEGMKARHAFLTSQDDYVYAAMLAASSVPAASGLEEMETFYRELHEAGIPKGNGLQSLTHVLVLGEESHFSKLDKVDRLNRHLISCGYRLRDYHTAFLGVMALLTDQPEALADQALELERHLMTFRGFGNFSIDKKTRFVLAAYLLISQKMETFTQDISRTALANSIQSILIAQQMAMTAAIVAATTSAGASSGGA